MYIFGKVLSFLMKNYTNHLKILHILPKKNFKTCLQACQETEKYVEIDKLGKKKT